MIFALLAAAAPIAASLDLELACTGEYADVETSTGRANSYDAQGNYSTGTVTLNKTVMKPGVAKVSVHGSSARLVYPDGRARTMEDVVGDEARITGSYKRQEEGPALHLHLEDGDQSVDRRHPGQERRGGRFHRTCALAPAAPTQPKF